MPPPHKKSFAAEQLAKRQKNKVSPVVWVLVGVVVVALVVGGFVMYRRSVAKKQVETEQEKIKSIAVLPFRDMSPEKDQEYLGDGIAETIINTLTQINNINVPASTSSSAFKGKDLSIIEIGKQLKVETVLEGTVQKEGNFLRVTAQLINVEDGFHLWSKRYEREFDSIFAIQDSISYAIVEELKGKLPGDEKAFIEKRYTEDVEAYDLYLLGQYYWNNKYKIEEGPKKALEYYLLALDRDINFALAYTGIADFYNMYVYDWFSVYYPIAKEAAKKAIEIDNTLAEAYVSLGWVNLYYDWDWDAAEKAFQRALELNPDYYLAHQWYTDYLLVMGRLNKALEEIRRSEELNPQYGPAIRLKMSILLELGKYDEAMEEFYKLEKINKDWAYFKLAGHYTLKGNYKDALNSMKKVSKDSFLYPYIGYLYALSGEDEKAEQILHEYIEQRKELFKSIVIEEEIEWLITQNLEKYLPSIDINQIIRTLKERNTEQNFITKGFTAMIYTGLGKHDKALDIMEIACERGERWVLQSTIWSEYDPLSSNPRYKALLKKMGLPED